jgi:uncharacterized Tic20 family protein
MLWFVLWVACMIIASMMATSEVGPVGCFFGAALGTLAFVFIALIVIVIMAFSTNSCKEYGYPDDPMTQTCSDSDIQYHIEHSG